MQPPDVTRASPQPPAHPLAVELAAAVAGRVPPPALLLLGVGSGRNVPALLAWGASVEALEPDADRARTTMARSHGLLHVTAGSYAGPYPWANRFAGALSTHALLHGTRAEIAAAVAAVHGALEAGGLLYATLGSTRDPRYGRGRRLAVQTFAPVVGSERGVPHTYFSERDARALLSNFEIETLAEASAAATAGTWAHSPAEASDLVHWFVRASARRSHASPGD